MFLEFGPSQSKIWDCLEPKNRKFFTNLARNRKWNRNRNRGNPSWESEEGKRGEEVTFRGVLISSRAIKISIWP